jgi:hypothetical protein
MADVLSSGGKRHMEHCEVRQWQDDLQDDEHGAVEHHTIFCTLNIQISVGDP